MRLKTIGLLAVAGSLAVASQAAAAASKPTVSTGGVSAVTQTGATLNGAVNPQAQSTTYYFQYGTSVAYGSQTGLASAGAGATAVKRAAPITGLTPATTYHYRIVATNATGTTVGADKTFETKKQPLGLQLLANPNPAPFGGPVTLQGTLTGTGNGGRGIVLQQKAFPYTAGWENVGNPQVTSATGTFAFPVVSLTQNTQFRVVTTGSGSIASPIVIAGSAVKVSVNVTTHSPKAGSVVRFAGSVYPREDGALYAIQKQKGAAWVTVAGSSLRPYTSTASRFGIRVKVSHSGTYRVYVGVADGSHFSNTSALEVFKVKPRAGHR